MWALRFCSVSPAPSPLLKSKCSGFLSAASAAAVVAATAGCERGVVEAGGGLGQGAGSGACPSAGSGACPSAGSGSSGKGGTLELVALLEKAPLGAAEEVLAPLVEVVSGEEVEEVALSVGAVSGTCEAGGCPVITGIS